VKGTWLLVVVAVLPVLVLEVVAAAPGYPVEDPAGAPVAVVYDASTHVLSIDSSTVETSEDPVAGDTSVSGVVEGPSGQINHGQVIKQLHELTEGPASGCLTSAVARSDLGEGDQKVTTDEYGSTGSSGATDGAVTTIETDCTDSGRSNDQASSKSSENSSANRPTAPGKSDSAPGNSNGAPGKDK
jgi:hypothetical protein